MAKKSNLAAYKLSPEKLPLVAKNLGLVRTVIRDKFSVYHEWYDDMMQEGTIGLIKAISKHDESKGAQLSTFAYFCIKNEIQKFVSECTDTIRVPVSVGLAINGVRLVEERGGTQDEIDYVLEHNQVSADMIKAGKTALATVSMDDENEEGLPYRDVIAGMPINSFDPTVSDKEMWSDVHTWFNFNYPEDFLNNRIYIDYIAAKHTGLLKVNEIYDIIANTYFINKAFIRKLIPTYNARLNIYLRKYAKNIEFRK